MKTVSLQLSIVLIVAFQFGVSFSEHAKDKVEKAGKVNLKEARLAEFKSSNSQIRSTKSTNVKDTSHIKGASTKDASVKDEFSDGSSCYNSRYAACDSLCMVVLPYYSNLPFRSGCFDQNEACWCCDPTLDSDSDVEICPDPDDTNCNYGCHQFSLADITNCPSYYGGAGYGGFPYGGAGYPGAGAAYGGAGYPGAGAAYGGFPYGAGYPGMGAYPGYPATT